MKQFAAFAIVIMTVLLSGCTAGTGTEAYSDTRFMLDTVCTIEYGGKDAQAAVDAAFERISDIQSETDFYNESSTISEFNRAAAGIPVKLDADTAEIIKTALEIYEHSGGVFDITVAPVAQLWNFKDTSDREPPSDEEIKQQLEYIGSDKLIFDYASKTLEKTKDGVKIDLGGAAKGYAADAAAEVLKSRGADYALINLGGNVYAFGSNPKKRSGEWQIGIQKPFADSGTYSQTADIQGSGAVVTSGIYQRGFKHKGRLYHHILNPFSGYPAETEFSGVTVKADNALLADCLSTACIILDNESAAKLAESYGTEIYTEK